MPIKLSIKVDTRALERQLGAMKRQIPFALAQALNSTLRKVQDAETAAIASTFDQPRAFTKSAFTMSPSFGGKYATKSSLVAVMVAKPIQERYLAPSEFNEVQHVGAGGKRHITPVNVKLNASNDIPTGTVARLLQQPDCFMGVVNGVNGIWQRPTPKRPKGSPRRRGIKDNNSGRLKLLIAFTRPVKIKPHLAYFERARAVFEANWSREFDAALTRAIATAR